MCKSMQSLSVLLPPPLDGPSGVGGLLPDLLRELSLLRLCLLPRLLLLLLQLLLLRLRLRLLRFR